MSDTNKKVKIGVITATLGRDELKKCISSVIDNIIDVDGRHMNVEVTHYIVFDGPEASAKRKNFDFELRRHPRIKVIELPFPTGDEGDYGHKIIMGLCSLIKDDYVCFLDDDNIFLSNHIYSLYSLIEKKNLDWAFSLRNFTDRTEKIQDLAESLGPYKLIENFSNPNGFPSDSLIDTNCYFMKRVLALNIKTQFEQKFGSDRVVACYLMKYFPNFGCTHLCTVDYYTKDFLIFKNFCEKENKVPDPKAIYLFHFDEEHTQKLLDYLKGYQDAVDKFGDKAMYHPNFGQYQYQLNMFFGSGLNFVNGFKLYKYAPKGSVFLVNLLTDKNIPEDFFNRLATKIVYTIESPNIRHASQWSVDFLDKFDHIFSYWKDLSKTKVSKKVHYMPFVNKYNLKPLVRGKPIEERSFKINKDFVGGKPGKSIGMVLENRNFGSKYVINGVTLTSQDSLRFMYAKYFSEDILCYGESWKDTGIDYKPTKPRFLDQEFVIDLLQNHTFALIIENTDAKGYVSEKVFDALAAGCIPIYMLNEGCEEQETALKDLCILFTKDVLPPKLVETISGLTEQQICDYQTRILEKRKGVIRQFSTERYYEKVKNFITLL